MFRTIRNPNDALRIADCRRCLLSFLEHLYPVTLPNWVGWLEYLGRTAGKFTLNKATGGRTFSVKRTTLGTAPVLGLHRIQRNFM